MEGRILNLEGSVLRMAGSVGKLEANVSHIQKDLGEFKTEMKADLGKMSDRMDRDFRVLFGALITVALGLGGLMAKGFGWL
jgi:hypothetical protein